MHCEERGTSNRLTARDISRIGCGVTLRDDYFTGQEGAARNGTKEFLQFLHIALGSLSELDTQIEISRATGVGDGSQLEHLQELTTRVKMMTNGLVRSLK